jgi:hypothetical protein
MSKRGQLHRQRGQALVEFALVFPVVILMLVGLFDLGRAVFAYNTVTNAAREGARLAIVNQDKALIIQRAESLAFTAEQNLSAANHIGFYAASRDLTGLDPEDPLPAEDCLSSGSLSIGCQAVVRYETRYQAITPIIGALVGPITMRAQTILPIEFVCPNETIVSSANCPRQP